MESRQSTSKKRQNTTRSLRYQRGSDREEMNGEKLYTQLNSLFESDDLIDELGLVVSANPQDHPEAKKTLAPTDPNEKAPFILFNHKLGIAYWCIPRLYSYCLEKFREIRTRVYPDGDKDPLLIKQLQLLTRGILLINADCYSALNVRKKMIIDDFTTREEEIKLLNLVFSKHPKSGEAWAHRRWVLYSKDTQANSTTSSLKNSSAKIFLEKQIRSELKLCTRMGEIYPKNYYSWSHRAWVLNLAPDDVIKEELEAMEVWTKRNVSDYCGYHHKQIVLLKLAERKIHENIGELWLKEFDNSTHLIQTYPGHEALWCHRRALVYFFCVIVAPQYTNTEIQTIIEKEIEFSDERATDEGEYHHAEQRVFALRYKSFILEIVAPSIKNGNEFSNMATNFTELLECDKMHSVMWQYKLDNKLKTSN